MRRFRRLSDLIEAELTNLSNREVPAVAIVVPENRTFDVYSNLGSGVDTSREFIGSLDWVLAERTDGGCWVKKFVDPKIRQQIMSNMTA